MSSPEPGWYVAGDQLRWWNGTAWTADVQPLPSEQPGSPGPGQQITHGGPPGPGYGSAPQVSMPPDTLWFAFGRPISGIGGGRYRLTEQYLFFEKGTLRTDAQQIPIKDLYDIDASQSMTQKARGVGTITVHVRGPGNAEVVRLEDIENFREGVQALNAAALAERERLRRRSSTQVIEQHTTFGFAPGTGMPVPTPAPAPAVPPAPQGSSSDEVLSALERLGQLRASGVVTDAEFEAKKAELLRRL